MCILMLQDKYPHTNIVFVWQLFSCCNPWSAPRERHTVSEGQISLMLPLFLCHYPLAIAVDMLLHAVAVASVLEGAVVDSPL